MIDWPYWRWVTVRNTPLAVIVFMLVVTLGVVGLRSLPKEYSATSRAVLETPLALSDTPGAARSAQDIQHLQVVIHDLFTTSSRSTLAAELGVPIESVTSEALTVEIESGRNNPTFLSITANAPKPGLALRLSQAAARRAIALSNTIQHERVEASLDRLLEINARNDQALLSAKRASDALPLVGDTELSEMIERAKGLRDRIDGIAPQIGTNNPNLAKLQRDLAEARGLYSDIHPKVRLLLKRIAMEGGTQIRDTSASLEQMLAVSEQQISQMRVTQANAIQSQQALSKAKQDVVQSQDALIAARLRGEESLTPLKLIEDPSLPAAGPDGKELALTLALVLAGMTLSLGSVALRYRSDNRIHRPADLARTLGITPFATLPDLGPSLS